MATHESQKFALAEMIMHMKPTDDHCEDSFFIKSLRKSAANQIAHAKMIELREGAKERLRNEEGGEEKLKQIEAAAAKPKCDVTPIKKDGVTDGEVLANGGV